MRGLGIAIATLWAAAAWGYNADPWPGQGDFGTHATVTRVAVEYLLSNAQGPANRAAAWIARFAAPGADRVLARKTVDSAFLRGANGPDRLDTAVDVAETELCFPGHDLHRTVRVPGASVKILGKSFAIWKERRIPIALASFTDRLARLIPDRTAQAILGLLGKKTCSAHVSLGGEVPMHAAGLNHFISQGRPQGWRMTKDSSIFARLPEAVSGELFQKITAALGKVLPWDVLRRAVPDAGKWLDGKVREAVAEASAPLTRFVIDRILNQLVTVKRLRFLFDRRGEPAMERQPRLPIGKVQFDSASVRADWWYRKARRYWAQGKEVEAVLALGHSAHFLQDNALPHHSWGFLLRGHGPYEDAAHRILAEEFKARRWIGSPRFSARLGAILRALGARTGSPGQLIREKLWPAVRRRYPDLRAP